jgi:hypothetical protein
VDSKERLWGWRRRIPLYRRRSTAHYSLSSEYRHRLLAMILSSLPAICSYCRNELTSCLFLRPSNNSAHPPTTSLLLPFAARFCSLFHSLSSLWVLELCPASLGVERGASTNTAATSTVLAVPGCRAPASSRRGADPPSHPPRPRAPPRPIPTTPCRPSRYPRCTKWLHKEPWLVCEPPTIIGIAGAAGN